ncbi:MAG: hypothetical protein LBL42_06510 [Tannerella sp.]|jgi:hypothetical protein|nr:hypothetical protein [Tannerella sp.]
MDILPLQGAGRGVHYLSQGVAIGLGYIGLSAQSWSEDFNLQRFSDLPYFQVANFTLNSPTMNVSVAADSRVHAAVRFYSHTLQRIRPKLFLLNFTVFHVL